MSSNNLKSRKQNRKRAITALENAPYSQSKRQKYSNHHQLYNNRIELERITINPHPYTTNTTTNKGWREKHPIRSCRRKTNYRLLNVYGANYRQKKQHHNTINNTNKINKINKINNNDTTCSPYETNNENTQINESSSSYSSASSSISHSQNNNNNLLLHDSSCSTHRKLTHTLTHTLTTTTMPWKTIAPHPSNPDIPIYVLSEDPPPPPPHPHPHCANTHTNNNTDDDSLSITTTATQETLTLPTTTTTTIEPIVDNKGYMQFTPGLIICKQYAMVRQLGKGTFSRVFECNDIHSNSQQKYAVKVIRNVYKYQLAAQTELAILHKIRRHDAHNTSCCIHIICNAEYRGHPIFVFPLLSRSIYSFMVYNGCKPFKYDDVVSLMYQICHGVAYIHSLNIIITDLKPENIVLVHDDIVHGRNNNAAFCTPKSTQIKLIDFGSAVYDDGSDKKHKHLIQTRHYRAPEVVFKLAWKFSADIWSVGCILVELLYGKMLFNTHDSIDHLNQMVKCIDPPPSCLLERIDDETWNDYFDSRGALNMYKAKRSPVQCKKLETYFKGKKEAKLLYDLCTKMLCWNPEDRITAKEALRHKVFQNFHAK